MSLTHWRDFASDKIMASLSTRRMWQFFISRVLIEDSIPDQKNYESHHLDLASLSSPSSIFRTTPRNTVQSDFRLWLAWSRISSNSQGWTHVSTSRASTSQRPAFHGNRGRPRLLVLASSANLERAGLPIHRDHQLWHHWSSISSLGNLSCYPWDDQICALPWYDDQAVLGRRPRRIDKACLKGDSDITWLRERQFWKYGGRQWEDKSDSRISESRSFIREWCAIDHGGFYSKQFNQ